MAARRRSSASMRCWAEAVALAAAAKAVALRAGPHGVLRRHHGQARP
jgi:hypothetical protein